MIYFVIEVGTSSTGNGVRPKGREKGFTLEYGELSSLGPFGLK